jgi:predicted Ser/Thr protein kinase
VEVSPSTLISPRDEQSELLRLVIREQERTNDLLEELVGVMATREKQRANELNQWRNAHPQLSAACRQAAEALSRVQIEYLDRITDEINDSSEDMVEGDFVLNEFIDRYGPRLAHLNGVIQVLAQLSSVANPANAQS